MNTIVRIQKNDDGFSIDGDLTFGTVVEVYERTNSYFKPQSKFVINLNAVSKCDSASLSLLARWMRLADKHKIDLRYSGLPEGMMALSRVSGLDEILPLQVKD